MTTIHEPDWQDGNEEDADHPNLMRFLTDEEWVISDRDLVAAIAQLEQTRKNREATR